jgi:hypothetical protein
VCCRLCNYFNLILHYWSTFQYMYIERASAAGRLQYFTCVHLLGSSRGQAASCLLYFTSMADLFAVPHFKKSSSRNCPSLVLSPARPSDAAGHRGARGGRSDESRVEVKMPIADNVLGTNHSWRHRDARLLFLQPPFVNLRRAHSNSSATFCFMSSSV